MAFMTTQKFFGLLGQVYGLSASVVSGVINTVLNGKLVIQSGARTLSLYFDVNQYGTIDSGADSLNLLSANAIPYRFRSGSGNLMVGTNAAFFRLLSGGQWGWSSHATDANTGPDTGVKRVAATVVAPTDGAAGGGWLQNTAGRSRVVNDITNVTITPAAITGLSATLIAGRKYTGRMVLFCSEATAADGLRLDYDGGTATMTSFIAQGGLSDDNGFQAIARTTAIASDTTNTTITGSTVVTVELSFVCNAAGTFIPRFAKEADAAGAALTITAGSYMWLEDMPA